MEEQRKSENALVPALRFEGFSDPWEQRKVGEILQIAFRAVDLEDDKKYQLVTVKRRNEGIVERARMAGRDILVKSYQEILAGDFVISKRQLVHGGNGLVPPHLSRSIVSNEYLVIEESKGISTEFWALISRTKSMYRQYFLSSFGVDIEKLVFDVQDWKKREITFPKRREQEKLETLFQKLDSLIALHQRKHEKLKTVKQSLLEKMFPKEGEDVPEIRFEGFTDPWEQRKLGEVAHRVIRKNEEGMSDLPLTISAQHGLVDQRDFFNSQVASRDMRGYYLLERGEFAYNKSTSSDSPWGAIKRLTEYEKGCLSTLYICFGLDEGDPDFLVTYYETSRWHRGIRMIAAEGARNHGLLNIAPGDFFETELTLPGKIEEQTAIGALFAKLDSLIALHQRERAGV